MLLKYFYDTPLAHASYLVGCQRSGEAIVIDPGRDVDPYLDEAAAEGLRIVGAAETHIHADFVSGSRELADRVGATLYLSDEGPADWKYPFDSENSVTSFQNVLSLSRAGIAGASPRADAGVALCARRIGTVATSGPTSGAIRYGAASRSARLTYDMRAS